MTYPMITHDNDTLCFLITATIMLMKKVQKQTGWTKPVKMQAIS